MRLTQDEIDATVALVARQNPTLSADDLSSVVASTVQTIGSSYLSLCRSHGWSVSEHVADRATALAKAMSSRHTTDAERQIAKAFGRGGSGAA